MYSCIDNVTENHGHLFLFFHLNGGCFSRPNASAASEVCFTGLLLIRQCLNACTVYEIKLKINSSLCVKLNQTI